MATDGNVTGYRRQIADRNFQNWVKAYLAIKITKEGINDCVSMGIDNFHEKILIDVRASEQIEAGEICRHCTTENVLPCMTKRICVMKKSRQCQFHCSEEKQFRPCPKGICNGLRDKIKAFHKHSIPSWSNTRAEKWCEHPWETAKCYMPPDAYFAADTINDTDFNGILSVIINHKEFKDTFNEDLCVSVRENVNSVRHAPGLLLTVEELNDTIDTLSSFLTCSECLKNDEKATEALQNIEKLKNAQLTISTDEISTILQDVLEKNSHICQNVTRLLKQAIDTLNEEHTHEHDTLDQIFTLLKDILDAIRYSTDGQPTITEERFQDIKQKMQQDLLEFNKLHHSTIPLSPLFEEEDTDLVGFYVFPTLETVDVQRSMFRGRSTEKRAPVSSLRDIFFKNCERCREIFVTSEAGLGKTAFSKRLIVEWYYSNQSVQTKYFSETDLQVMREFEFAFLISLRDTHKLDCEIDEMIYHQIVNHLAHSHLYTLDILQEILDREPCLIVLDGLDEWSHPQEKPTCTAECPQMPHRKAWRKCSVVTTTRPWKLTELSLKSSQIDKHIQIAGLDSESTNELTVNTVSKLHFNEMEDTEDYVEKFNKEIRDKSIQTFTAVPLVLTYLICLWRINKPLGNSKCDIYSNLIGLLFFHAEQKDTEYDQIRCTDTKRRKTQMPNSIQSNEYCCKYYKFLLRLGHLAFETFFDKSREKSFAFDVDVASENLTEQDIKFSLEIGILTKNRDLESLTSRKSRLSFQHQTFQEYLAALYIQSACDFHAVLQTITTVCNSVESILTMSNVCIFLSGLCPERASDLSLELCERVTASDIAKGYRRDMGSWNYFIGYNKTMREYQDMHVACVEEYKKNFAVEKPTVDIHLEDYFIDAEFRSKYSTFLSTLMEMNRKRIKSIKIRDVETKQGFCKVVGLLERNKIETLEKIDIKCEISEEDLERLLKSSAGTLKCFIMKGGKWNDGRWKESDISLSNETFSTIISAQNLEELYLRNIEMTHDQMHKLATYVTNKQYMRHIGICFIKCSDHADKCPGFSFDLSGHTQLKMLELGAAPFSDICVNTSSLEVCYVGHFSIPGAVSSFLACLSDAPKLHVFCCGCLKSEPDIDKLMKTIPKLVVSQHIWLFEMDLGESKCAICPNTLTIENFLMIKVRMNVKTLNGLLRAICDSRQDIRVGLFECDVCPKEEYEAVKEKIQKSDRFKVLLDGKDDRDRTEFLLYKASEKVQ